MLDDAAARWGVPVKGGEFQYTVNAERLNMVWNRIESDKLYYGGKFLQLIDRLQRMWKSGVTIYSPSHHIRNLNGDIFLAALDGVTSVVPYRKAFQVMHAFRNRYRD